MRIMLMLAVLTVAACDDDSSDGDAWPCPAEQCFSCELGYYGARPIPAGATRVRADGVGAAGVSFLDGDPNSGTSATIGTDDASTLPAVFTLPAGTNHLVVTGPAGLSVSYDVCTATTTR